MSKRSKTANAAAKGGRGRRPALGACVLGVWLATWAGAPGAVRADEILLQSGELIEGSIVDATRNTVVIRRAIGGMRQMRIRDIEEVRIELAQGQSITGRILSWVDGVHRIRVGDEVVSVRGGLVLSRAPYEEPAGQPSLPAPPGSEQQPTREAGEAAARAAAERAATERAAAETAAAEKTAAEKAAAERAAAERAAAERAAAEKAAAEKAAAEKAAAERAAAERAAAEKAGAEKAAAERAAAEKAAAEKAAAERAAAEKAAAEEAAEKAASRDENDQPGAVAVTASVEEPARAGAAGVVFRIELSRPVEKTVVLIYGTVDGTAKAGEDYEPREGVLTLAPGTRSADVRVPLIEDQLRKDDTRFELFLTADPKVAKIVDQRITATIPGNG